MAQANTIRFRTLAEELRVLKSCEFSMFEKTAILPSYPNLMQDMHAIAVAAAGCLAC
jgi:hypothetical protein